MNIDCIWDLIVRKYSKRGEFLGFACQLCDPLPDYCSDDECDCVSCCMKTPYEPTTLYNRDSIVTHLTEHGYKVTKSHKEIFNKYKIVKLNYLGLPKQNP